MSTSATRAATAPGKGTAALNVREATPADLDRLMDIEQRCFEADRLSRRSFRHLLTRGHARTLVCLDSTGTVCGYVLVLLHQGTRLARIYSLAVDPSARGTGVATRLVDAAETQSRADGTAAVRLEVRADNQAARALYERLGYQAFETVHDYYEDGESAVRMEKPLATALAPCLREVPYYRQTVGFTCGPAALMMAMRTLDARAPLDQSTEFRLWRESTTVYMTSGHGGCSPYGLALAAHGRGLAVEVYAAGGAELFTESVRTPAARDIIRLVQQDYLAGLAEAGVPVSDAPLDVSELERRFAAGCVPVVLISTWRMDRQKSPHWVTVTGFDTHHVYINDPWVDAARHKTDTDCVRVPVARRDFDRMSRYGRARRRAALLLCRRSRR